MKSSFRPDDATALPNAVAGAAMIGVVIAVSGLEYGGPAVLGWLAGGLSLLAVAICTIGGRFGPRAFVAIGAALTVWAMLSLPDWRDGLARAIANGSLIVAMFTALVALRSAAAGSAAIVECGRFLARQRPGQRYAALTMGGHLFGLTLLYGAISLLGALATESARDEPDAEIRRHRTRRMLVAIQRGFAATLCWSPMAFSMVIGLSLVEGARWNAAVLPCAISAVILLAGGWGLDAAFKPRLSRPAPPRAREPGRWLDHLRPLLVLLGVVMGGAAALHLLTGVEVIGAVISFIPLVAAGWIILQTRSQGLGMSQARGRIGQFLFRELPGYRHEVVLLFMAAFIGKIGALILVPLMEARGIGLEGMAPLVVVIALIWIIPLTGQIGMNPILAVSLMVPILPTPAEMGISPTVMITAITGGWALSGVSSPFTASVLLAASLGGVSPRHVGLVWNGVYVLIMGTVLSLWVTALAVLL
ncbi:MAG: hypothetical protein Q4G25_10830 [Paracoccus sp. (in: a-proteobacteria)]|nr:hypothetical protein [Paracoccus sp. (in: a-proteobacteria)]